MNNSHSPELGLSGRIAKTFQASAITPLLALVGLLLGIFAVIITPKEEDPQIDVTFADVFIPFPGATPSEVQNLVTLPAEQIISEIKGVDTLYSFSQPDGALIITIFEVGVPRDEAVVNIYNQLFSNRDKFNQAAGIVEPLIKPRGIDDVPIVSLTLYSKSNETGAEELTHVAANLETELKRIPGTREIYTQGRHDMVLNIRLDSAKMNAFGVTVDQIEQRLQDNNQVSMLNSWVQNNQQIKVRAGQFINSIDDIKSLLIKVIPAQSQPQHNITPLAKAVYLADVAEITLKSDIPNQHVRHVDQNGDYPAVTIAIGKQAGQNAVVIADKILNRINEVQNVLIPDSVKVAVSRNYGQTAGDKANTLIFKLIFATSAVVLLVFFTMGLRESAVVGIAIIITLAMTLFASWAWGFSLNRISLFALIFSIGILVDDAIVVVENIHRHMALSNKPLLEIIPIAVDEVGGPTILATFTVIAALLPMAFVSGLMGPYMSPIPINASMGMLLSLVIAFMMTPWLSNKLLHRHVSKNANTESHFEHDEHSNDKLSLFFNRLMTPFLLGDKAGKARKGLAVGIVALIAIAVSLPAMQAVVLKMLPFDNKSEFQVMVDLPEGTPVEQTQRVLQEMSQYLATVEEIDHQQWYAGTHSPMNFNGLVRHYFLRSSQELGDIQVNLVDKSHRHRDSHAIALAVRGPLNDIAKPYNAKVKVVEVPPGPPVWSPIVAEVYGPTTALREQAALELETRFNQTEHVVDVDIFLPQSQQQWQVSIDRSKASLLGLSYGQIINTISTAVGGKDISYLHLDSNKQPTPIRLQVNEGEKVNLAQILNLKLTNNLGEQISLAAVTSIKQGHINASIVHKNMIPMIMVVADMAGPTDSPLYGMFDIASQLNDANINKQFPIAQHYVEQPDGISEVAILWDGEWKITYETFRDMGIAYAVGMIAIYLLVVGQFKSYLVPLVIMAPIPLTVIGVMPGHAILGAQFTATSMIGMIALAGIIVRNSILLVDFINQLLASGMPLEKAVIKSAAVRAKPIMLTALAAMIGALFIIDDPIFNGLAISLIFGIFISTILTLLVIPVLYFSVMKNRHII